METGSNCPTNETPDTSVLSPLCGMETIFVLNDNTVVIKGSKPTVWDGDNSLNAKPVFCCFCLGLGSKPTVWDGDFFKPKRTEEFKQVVLSPLCGMETKSF